MSNRVAPYFSVGGVMGGLAVVFEELFGVAMDVLPAAAGEVWDDRVVKLALRDVASDVRRSSTHAT